MKILLTGATGYIGKRLMPILLSEGHHVIACTRDRSRFEQKELFKKQLTVLEIDFLEDHTDYELPQDIDIAYYLIHSMASSIGGFSDKESIAAQNFKTLIDNTNCRQIIYLTGIINESVELSAHLKSRFDVEKILEQSIAPLTALRAGIIVGSGSASFEIIRDLAEKLPIMITPKWLNTKCQPIAIENVIEFLTGVVLDNRTFNKNFDIGGSDVLTYKQMLLGYAEVRKLKRYIFTVPVMTPRLSSYWLYFVTSISYPLAINLVDSMKIDVICRNNDLAIMLGIIDIPYKQAVERAFKKIEQNMVVSSWKDSFVSSLDQATLHANIEVPSYGCFKDLKKRRLKPTRLTQIKDNIWSIGGNRGWYYGNLLWAIRGYLDKLAGGVGLRRGRTHNTEIHVGDVIDFWRVLVADKDKGRLLLFAEMKLPGDAWLEFEISDEDGQSTIQQTATFRPSGIFGRLYWYSVLPFHWFIFNGMIDNLIKYESKVAS